MTEGVVNGFVEYGILGLLVVVLTGAVTYLFKKLMSNHETELERNAEVVKALTESAHASNQVARSMEQTNELLRSLLARPGGA